MPVVVISSNTTGAYAGDYSGNIDNGTEGWDPNTNHGSAADVLWGAGTTLPLFISFNAGLAALKAAEGSGTFTVNSVTLALHDPNEDNPGSTFTLHRILRNWSEAQSTWNVWATGQNWSSGGANGSGTDRAATASFGPTSVGLTSGWFLVSGAGLATDVAAILNETDTFYGWRVAGGDEDFAFIDMREGTNGFRPALIVDYTFSGGGGLQLEADGGTYSHTGGDVGLLAHRTMSADGGSMSYSGADVSLERTRRLSVGGATHTYSGGEAGLLARRALDVQGASYSCTGTGAEFTHRRILLADGGTHTYAGGEALLSRTLGLLAEGGSYSYAGGDAEFSVVSGLVAEGGSYSYVGGDVDLRVARDLLAAGGVYEYVGGDASFAAHRQIVIDAGTYSFIGSDLGLIVGRSLLAEGGVYTYAGGDASLTHVKDSTLAANAGSFSYSVADALLVAKRRLSVSGATFAHQGSDAELIVARGLLAEGGIYGYAGADAAFTHHAAARLLAEGGVYVYQGASVSLSWSGGLGEPPVIFRVEILADEIMFRLPPADEMMFRVR